MNLFYYIFFGIFYINGGVGQFRLVEKVLNSSIPFRVYLPSVIIIVAHALSIFGFNKGLSLINSSNAEFNLSKESSFCGMKFKAYAPISLTPKSNACLAKASLSLCSIYAIKDKMLSASFFTAPK